MPLIYKKNYLCKENIKDSEQGKILGVYERVVLVDIISQKNWYANLSIHWMMHMEWKVWPHGVADISSDGTKRSPHITHPTRMVVT